MSKKGVSYYLQLNDRRWLYQKYWGESLSYSKISEEIGCCPQTVSNALSSSNISVRTRSEAEKGRKLTEEHKRKISKANKGKKRTEEAREKVRKARQGKHHTEATKQKIREARKHQPTHHTKPELIFEEICKKHNLPFKYTGNGDFWIENINPDFVDVNGKKIAVEVFGDYWHSPLLQWDLREDRTLDYRKKILKKYGWKLIVFWESDLKRKDVEQFVLSGLEKHKVF